MDEKLFNLLFNLFFYLGCCFCFCFLLFMIPFTIIFSTTKSDPVGVIINYGFDINEDCYPTGSLYWHSPPNATIWRIWYEWEYFKHYEDVPEKGTGEIYTKLECFLNYEDALFTNNTLYIGKIMEFYPNQHTVIGEAKPNSFERAKEKYERLIESTIATILGFCLLPCIFLCVIVGIHLSGH